MSSGQVHSRVTTTLAITGGLIGAYYDSLPAGVPIFLGAMTGHIITPDWDVDGGNISYKYLRRLKLEWLLRTWVKPYAISYKHRSNWSHFPIFSTLWRLIYLCVPFVVLVTKNQETPNLSIVMALLWAIPLGILLMWAIWYFWFLISPFLLYWLIGLMISDIAHYIADML